MSTETNSQATIKGGEWLIKDSNAFNTFIAEDFNEEQKMVLDMCHQFIHGEVMPVVDRLDQYIQRIDCVERIAFLFSVQKDCIW